MDINNFLTMIDRNFRVPLAHGGSLELRLLAVDPLKPRTLPAYPTASVQLRAEPFRLTFLGPATPRLADGVVAMTDDSGQHLELGLSAFAGNDQGIYYDAYFS